MNNLTAKELFDWRKKQLSLGGRKADLDWLLDLGAGLSWTEMQALYLDKKKTFFVSKTLDELSGFWRIHLEENIPLQYLLRICPWREFEVEVSPAVMIPRQETELLIEFALSRFKNSDKGVWVDLGTGSGVLAISLARSFLEWEGHVVDISQDALSLAKRNLMALASTAKYSVHCGKWWDPLKPWWGNLNLVLANPPYIPSSTLKTLDPIVYLNEPHLALSGGLDGLDSLKEIVFGALKALACGGCLMLEHHHDQSDQVLQLMDSGGLVGINYELDLEGVRRFAIGYKPL